jgi:hypothetical protein
MKKLLLLGITAAALTAAGTAQAAAGLGLRGETGLAKTPIAAALPPLTLAFAADFVASDDVFIPMRAEFGVIEGREMGGHYWYLDIPGDSEAWGVNAKYVFPPLVQNLGLAVGGHYREQNIGDINNNGHDVYFVATYPVGFFVPTFGVMYESLTGDNDESDVRFFGSIVFNVLPTFALGAEIMSASDKLDDLMYGEDADDPAMWFGARFMPLGGLTVQAGLLNYADLGGDIDDLEDFVFHIGMQYAFGFEQ